MEKKKRFEEAQRFINLKVPRKPKTLSLHELARKTASIKQNNVAMHKALPTAWHSRKGSKEQPCTRTCGSNATRS